MSYKANDKIKEYIVWRVGRYIRDKDGLNLFKPAEWWCEKCNHTWFSGRIGLYEVLEMTEKLENLMLKNASRVQLEIQAVWDGMIPIKDDALLKVVLWETSLDEILSVLGA